MIAGRLFHVIAVLIVAELFGAPYAFEDGDYRLAFFIFLAAACAWGWLYQYMQTDHGKVE